LSSLSDACGSLRSASDGRGGNGTGNCRSPRAHLVQLLLVEAERRLEKVKSSRILASTTAPVESPRGVFRVWAKEASA
jgi:hypothetical protein